MFRNILVTSPTLRVESARALEGISRAMLRNLLTYTNLQFKVVIKQIITHKICSLHVRDYDHHATSSTTIARHATSRNGPHALVASSSPSSSLYHHNLLRGRDGNFPHRSQKRSSRASRYKWCSSHQLE
jgi:hypothetical protein